MSSPRAATPDAESSDAFLNVALSIAHRLADRVQWKGDTCTWRLSSSKRAPGSVYRGTAGIALFLIEAARHTDAPRLEETAVGAVRFARDAARSMPETHVGFYDGRVGSAYALARTGHLLDRPPLVEQALDLLAPSIDVIDDSVDVSVMTGAAGAIPALLHIQSWTDSPTPACLAQRLGDAIVRRAFYEPVGWSWDTLGPLAMRHLTGYAHGASGVGHALLELHAVTGADQYLFAAEQAFRYERRFFDSAQSNWPDFRYAGLGRFLRSDAAQAKAALRRGDWQAALHTDDLREALRNDDLPAPSASYTTAWCHGAAGIGLARLRAFDLLKRDVYREEAQIAVETTRSSLDALSNYSLCHGIGGNSETLLYGASILGEGDLRRDVLKQARRGASIEESVEEDDSPSWPCGTPEATPDPSLMLGEAGIGYFYLRLHTPDTPSCLIRTAPESLQLPTSTLQRTTSPTVQSTPELKRSYIRTYFSQTLDVASALGDPSYVAPSVGKDALHDFETRLLDTDAAPVLTPVSVGKRLQDWLASQPEPLQTILRDASHVERTRLSLENDLDDFTDTLYDAVGLQTEIPGSWNQKTIRFTPQARLVTPIWDWPAWLDTPPADRNPMPSRNTSTYLLHASAKRVSSDVIPDLQKRLLRCLYTPATLDQLIQVLRETTNLDHLPISKLKSHVIDHLSQLYVRGVLELSASTDT